MATRDIEHVTCRLCHRQFKAISAGHLVRKHGFDPEHPVEEYLERFRLKHSKSQDVRRRARRTFIRFLESRGRRWTKARVLREIRSRVRRGKPINAGATQGRDGLHTTAEHLFGSWKAAVEAAGFSYAKVASRYLYWTREEILRRIRAEARAGRPVNHGALQKREPGLHWAALKHFKSWDRALRAAGIDPTRIRQWRKWTKKDLVRQIQEVARKVSPGKIRFEDPRLSSIGQALFGSWSAALRAAGVANWKGRKNWRWTPPEILAAIRQRSREGQLLTESAVHATSHGLLAAAKRQYGSWRGALEAAFTRN